MNKLLEMETFVSVVDQGSFVAVARLQSMSKAAVSRHVAAIEARLGVRLLQRTTRRLSLTEEGRVLYDRCKEVLNDIEDAESEITARRSNARGLIRINAPLTFGIMHLAPLWGEFMALYPEVTLEVTLSDRVVDIVEEGVDLAVRIADLASSTLVTRRLSSTRMVLCASPLYLQRHGEPLEPHEIAAHAVIGYSYLATRDEWHFDGPGGHVSIQTKPILRSNNGETCRLAALAHQGIILQPSFLVGEDLVDGRLRELLPNYRGREFGIYAVYPSRKHLQARVRLLIDFLAACFNEPRAAW